MGSKSKWRISTRIRREVCSARGGLRLGGLIVLMAAVIVCPAAWSKNLREAEKVKPLPLFMAPDFTFGQIDSICVAPLLDLRSDKSAPIFLSGKAPSVDFSRLPNAGEVLAGNLERLGYKTNSCSPVNSTLKDLTKLSGAWLRSLNFGTQRFLLIVAVEDVSATAIPIVPHPFAIGQAKGYDAGHAVVSGYLFEKLQDSAKLVWRDRVLGIQYSGVLMGRGSQAYAAEAVNSAVANLIWRFDRRSNKRPLLLFAVAEERFDSGCDAVWTALNVALNQDPKKYKVAYSGATDMMVLYTVHHLGPEDEDHIVLKGEAGSCVMQITQSWAMQESNDWGDLTKRVRALIANRETKNSH